jgi:hypothetical protein
MTTHKTCYLGIGGTTSHSAKPASGQVAGYPAEAGIQLIQQAPYCGDKTQLHFE